MDEHLQACQDAILNRCLMALSHPTRRTIIHRLSKRTSRVTELADELPIALNTVSKHIRVLESAGLVRREIRGRDHVLALQKDQLKWLRGWIDGMTTEWTAKLAALEEHLDHKAQNSKSEKRNG